jgi:hypothetical protein
MATVKGPQQATSSEEESAEDLCAVATITRLIHDLHAANAYAAIRERRDNELIKWSDVIGAVRGR